MSWFEVETKIRINKKDVPKIKEKIRKIADFSKREIKKDHYFAFFQNKKRDYPTKAFRIRYNGKEYIVNFKKWLKKIWSNKIVIKEEFEFKLKNPENFLALMKDLGFVEWIKKIKITENYVYKKDKKTMIELNKVKYLGYFIEIEYLARKNEINLAKRRIVDVLKELKIKTNQINNVGYTKTLWKKKKF